MEKKDANKEPFNRPDGVEVKLTAKSINIKGFLFFFILFLTGSYLFVYVWDEPSSYSAGRLLGTAVKGISSPLVMLYIFLLLVFYILIQAGILYWFSGKDKKLLHWHFDWTGVGFSLTRPIPLKFYRVSLLLPGILLGVMPAIHGFCTGEANIFFWDYLAFWVVREIFFFGTAFVPLMMKTCSSPAKKPFRPPL